MSLYQEARPAVFKDVVGNKEAIAVLTAALAKEKRPHAFLFHGKSGCGKTTLARIVARELGCDVDVNGSTDYVEVNASNTRGIDDVRRLVADTMYPPITGGVRVTVVDECHALTKDAQNCILKPLEDTPTYQYWCLCTTEPNKLLKTILTRCTHIEVKGLTEDDVFNLLVHTVQRFLPDQDPGDDVLNAIAARADGCPRTALTMLENAKGLKPEDAMAAVKNFQTKETQAFDLCRAMADSKPWSTVASIYNGLEDTDPEGLRRMLLGYLKSCLLKSKDQAAARRFAGMIEELSKNTFDSGEAGLLAQMWNATRVAKGD